MDIDIKVSQLVVSRICHDLAGSVSAVNAGVELIKDGGGTLDKEAMSLVDASAGQSVRKLSFFRIVFGSGGGVDETISLAELRDLSQNYIAGSKASLDWSNQTDADSADCRININEGRVLLGIVLMATDSLPRGGVISVGVHYPNGGPDGGVGFAVVATGERASLGPEVEAAMAPDINIEDLTARTVHAHFTNLLVGSLGGELEYSRETMGEIRLAAIIPL